MGKKAIITLILLILSLHTSAQQNPSDPKHPISKTDISLLPIDSTFVTFYPISFDSIFLISPHAIDTTLFFASDFDALYKEKTIYSTLSNTGLAHKSMRHDYSKPIGFDMALPSYSTFIKTEKNMESFFSVLPYSEIRYLMTTGDKEQHLNFKFGRQFAPRLFISLCFNSELSPGIFNNCRTNNNFFWINAHYTTKKQRYGIAAYWYRNKLEMQENGGITTDTDYSSHTESDNGVIAVNLSSATNFIKASGAGFEHYFNLLSLIKPITERLDTIQHTDTLYVIENAETNANANDTLATTERTLATSTRKFTLGRICHRFNYQRNQLFFNESSPSVRFYQDYDTLLNLSRTTDTTIVQAIRNELKWSSLGYQKHNGDVPFHIYAGIEHGLFTVKHFDYLEGKLEPTRNFNQVSVKGGVIANLFNTTRITGQAHIITLGYQIGDFDVKGQWKQYIGTKGKNIGNAIFDIEFKRQSASWFETSYTSNHFRWENDFNASSYLNLHLSYQYQSFRIGVKQSSINNLIYLGLDAKPEQYKGLCSVMEAYGDFHYVIKRFEFDGFASLQKASNTDIIHLPLLLGKLRAAYSQPIFHKAAILQPSITIQYFTKYLADAYMPALRAFYLQNQVEIGNFPYIDLAVALKVKTANLYASYSNMYLLTGNYESFIAPHYPMRNSRLFIGINWRLFD